MAKVRITVNLDPNTHQALSQDAEQNGRSMAAQAGMLLDEHYQDQKKAKKAQPAAKR